MKFITSLLLSLLLCVSLTTAVDPLGGAKPPKPDLSLKRKGQYKRVHQVALRYILLGRFDDAEGLLNDYGKQHPDDAETHYMRGVLDAQRQQPEQAVASLKRAIALGLPPSRIVAGPRAVMRPLEETDFVRNVKRDFVAMPVHGPLVGSVTASAASFWVRLASESSIQFVVSRSADMSDPIASQPAQATAESDFTCLATVDGLLPDTEYHSGFRIDDQPLQSSSSFHFRTFPKTGAPSKFTLAFGGGAGFVPANERMWDTIDSFHPQLMLLLGDNVYIDDPESPVMQRYTYQRRQSRPEWRRLTAHTPTFTIWDDHDFSVNDSWGGPLIDVPRWKIENSWPIFQQNWANPTYESGDRTGRIIQNVHSAQGAASSGNSVPKKPPVGDRPGCWYTFHVGDVDFVMLDCRYYRTDPEGDHPTMLGPVQLDWLQQTLSRLTGTFKVICSSVPWDYRTKGDSLDTWNGYRSERDAIFSFLDEQDIEGVILMSADRHRSDAWRIDRPGCYPLYEFNSSRLTNLHVHKTMEKAGALFSYNAEQSFGLVEFDTTAPDPTVKYTVVTIDGERVNELTVTREELKRN